MDSLDANFFTAFNVYQKIIDEDRLVRTHPKLLQSNLEDPRLGLCHAHLRRDDYLVEGIIEFLSDDEVTQVAPGV